MHVFLPPMSGLNKDLRAVSANLSFVSTNVSLATLLELFFF